MEPIQNDIKNSFGNIKKNVKREFEGGPLKEGYRELEKRARGAMEASEDVIREYPISTVLGAAAVGFVAAMLVRRGR